MTIIDTAQLDRLERLLDRFNALQRAFGVEVEPFAATDTDGNPSNVAAGELIESAWGNAVTDHVVKRFALGSRLPATKPTGQLVINTEPVAGRPPLIDMAYNNAWNVVWPRTTGEQYQGVALGGTFNTEAQVGAITVSALPYSRLALVTAAAMSNSGAVATTSVWEFRVKANGSLISRGQNLLGLTITPPPTLYTIPANTAVSFTASAVMTVGTGPWSVMSDGSLSHLDVLAWH